MPEAISPNLFAVDGNRCHHRLLGIRETYRQIFIKIKNGQCQAFFDLSWNAPGQWFQRAPPGRQRSIGLMCLTEKRIFFKKKVIYRFWLITHFLKNLVHRQQSNSKCYFFWAQLELPTNRERRGNSVRDRDAPNPLIFTLGDSNSIIC